MNMHTHDIGKPELGRRFFAEGTTIPLQPGCYVDGGVRTLFGALNASFDVAYGIGALTPANYAEFKAFLLEKGPEDPDIDGLDIQLIDIMNDANLSSQFHWEWIEGDLMYTATHD